MTKRVTRGLTKTELNELFDEFEKKIEKDIKKLDKAEKRNDKNAIRLWGLKLDEDLNTLDKIMLFMR